MRCSKKTLVVCALAALSFVLPASAQQPGSGSESPVNAPLTERERMLLDRIASLEQRVEALEGKRAVSHGPAIADEQSLSQAPAHTTPVAPANVAESKTPEPSSTPSFLGGTTLNVNLDTYYGYNFNNPIGRVNLLRGYDVSSNAISLNQAGLILDNLADPSNGKRLGFRLDFQYGQATQSLQGSSINEPRPDIYRNIFQAYGTYVLPVGKGLTVDFGKFASSLGIEGNYTKDQMNYSRSYWFGLLPFYHQGARVNYKFNHKVAFSYWLVNGTQQSEPFKGYKDEFFGVALQPAKRLSWNLNYYLGQEHPDVTYFPGGSAPPNAPNLQGVPFEPIVHPPRGKLHIFDTYLNFHATPKLAIAGEADYVIERLETFSTPLHSEGGALYAQYQFSPKLSFSGRGEYVSDRRGLYSGANQALKETTFTTKYQVEDGLDLFGEWRRDFSNQPFFYTSTSGELKKEQNTATLGLVWWMGGKQGAW